MDDSERRVHEYLSSLGFTDIVYEPDGKVPPDFLVEGRIAIEVRRLNQSEETDAGPRGLEEIAAPVRALVENVLASMGPPVAGASWFVLYTFRRPLPPWKDLERSFRRSLADFANHPNPGPTRVPAAQTFGIRIIRASKVHPTMFVLGGSADHDAGGFVLAEMERNLHICIGEKLKKIARVRDKYPEWWLVLVDHIGYALAEDEREQLRELVTIDDPWAKVILVNPFGPHRGFEL